MGEATSLSVNIISFVIVEKYFWMMIVSHECRIVCCRVVKGMDILLSV